MEKRMVMTHKRNGCDLFHVEPRATVARSVPELTALRNGCACPLHH